MIWVAIAIGVAAVIAIWVGAALAYLLARRDGWGE